MKEQYNERGNLNSAIPAMILLYDIVFNMICTGLLSLVMEILFKADGGQQMWIGL